VSADLALLRAHHDINSMMTIGAISNAATAMMKRMSAITTFQLISGETGNEAAVS
jgi:hypothetical protein